ncbi:MULTISPECIES: hypothetical protein [Corallococcus]|uniref:hypothetical protein n=1 Tax=Corallococcus TaxID=83461 RepID=UPI00117F2601|nr:MULTISPECIES: hypothetical protein [Corallococcus]NBD09138.1 hypothetical protein [Corallococcus silvisoli]TSC31168.1 hypothetical protein FOF48_10720 [Corallococcus sp. Z5C101001]
MLNKLTSVVCLGSALVVSACGGPEAQDGDGFAQQGARLTTATSQDCDYSVSTVQTTTSPPQYDVVVTRTGGVNCTLPTGVSQTIQNVPLSAPGPVSIVGSDLGLAVGFVMRNGFSGSAAYIFALRHVNPTTLATARNADIYCDYMTGNISTGTVSIGAAGTAVSVFGTKTGKINGQSGNYYSASFANFFTSTTAPTITVF